ncbi:MAG: condensation domain-containing protein, partial [Acidobacteriota bacterium]|nr:condensation domain-containing protein [Acidobacteriota bacterium]
MADLEDLYELSPMQQGMLFHTLHAPASGVYCEQFSCTLSGELDAAALERAWSAVAARHPVLRTAFYWEEVDKPLQAVYHSVEIPWRYDDWSGTSAGEQDRRFEEFLAADRRRGFELGAAPLLRLALFRLGSGEHRFVLTFHHLLMDGWGVPLVFSEVFAHYAAFCHGEVPHLPRPRPYREYITWLQLQDAALPQSFWRHELAGFASPTPLPWDLGPGRVGTPAERDLLLAERLSAALQRFVRDAQLTLNTVMQGAWAIALARSAGEDEVVFGATVAGRPAALPGVESMIGLFINTLPVRVTVEPGAELTGWLRRLQERHASARRFEHTPLVDIQGWSDVPRGLPLFESLLVFENFPVDSSSEAVRSDGLRVGDLKSIEITNYPLTLQVIPRGLVLLRLSYDSGRFSTAAVTGLLEQLETLLTAMAERPAARLRELPILSPGARHQLLREWNSEEHFT